MTQHAIQHSGWGFEVEGDGDFTTFVLGKSPDPVLRVSPKRVATDIGSYIKKELEPFLKSATQCVVTVPGKVVTLLRPEPRSPACSVFHRGAGEMHGGGYACSWMGSC